MMLELNWYVVFCLVFLLDMNIKFVCSEKEDFCAFTIRVLIRLVFSCVT